MVEENYPFRIKDKLVLENYIYKTENRINGQVRDIVRKIIIRHYEPQPIIFKSKILKQEDIDKPIKEVLDSIIFSKGFFKNNHDEDFLQYMIILSKKLENCSWVLGLNISN